MYVEKKNIQIGQWSWEKCVPRKWNSVSQSLCTCRVWCLSVGCRFPNSDHIRTCSIWQLDNRWLLEYLVAVSSRKWMTLWFTFGSVLCRLIFIWKTIQHFQARQWQHYRNISSAVRYGNNRLPFYRVIHRGQPFQFCPVPLFSITNCCDSELKLIENQWIARFHAPLNSRFVYKYDNIKHGASGNRRFMTSKHKRCMHLSLQTVDDGQLKTFTNILNWNLPSMWYLLVTMLLCGLQINQVVISVMWRLPMSTNLQ